MHKNVFSKIKQSERILLVPSSPIDKDSLGSALTFKWYLEEQGKSVVKIYVFNMIPKHFETLTGIEDVKQKNLSKVDLGTYDLIVLLDGNAWHQFFGSGWEKALEGIDIEKFLLIDHHESGQITKHLIKENTISAHECCTAKIIYDLFVKPSGLSLNANVALWLYGALLSDTGFFRHGVMKDTYKFAQELIDAEVEHDTASDENITLPEVKFLGWAIEHTNYYPEIKTTTLVIDEESAKILGNKGEPTGLVTHLYVEHIERKIEGFDYGMIFRVMKGGGTIASWRSRSAGETIKIQEVLEQLGFSAGGHRNAGSGNNRSLSPQESEKEFVAKMKEEFLKQESNF